MISAENTMAVCAVIFALAWFGFWVDTLAIGRKISGVVCVLVGAMLLSNFSLIPFKSAAYDFVGANLVPLAIPLLLFKSDLRKIFKESGRVMLIFFIAGAATAIGAVIGFYLFDLGDIGPKVAGVYTGGFVGGAVNFLAVSQVVQMSETEFSTAISASSIVSILALTLLLAIPSLAFVQRFFREKQEADSGQIDSTEHPAAKLKLSHLSGAIALSFAICALAKYISVLSGYEQYTFLVITVITLFIANVFPKQMAAVEGEYECGLLLMYLFFAVVGAGTDMSVFLGIAITLFFYGMFIIVFHLCSTLFVARKLGFRLDETVVASGAALVGPAVTAAIATSKNWRHLVTPGIMCGIFGYAIATFIGVAISQLLS
ncbi:MAG: DUF819 family protein [Cellvibrionaceae bacterium]|nr:DUF819 family protein [Cellvibrionaceae bacterium]